MRHSIHLIYLLFISTIACYIQPPRSTAVHLSATATATRDTPTAAPLIKRDVEDDYDDLDLYQAWASMCKSGVKNNNALIASASVGDVNNLWKTVTQTVNCGKGTAITVTTTVSPSSPTSFTCPTKSNQSKPKTCTGQCWSDYLWHTYGDGVSPAQGFTGTVCVIAGIYFSILATRFYRPTLGLVGFIFFATMTWIGLVNNEPAGGYPLGDVIYICVSAGLGILGAIILIFVHPVGVYVLACLGGFYAAVFILSWKDDLLITIKVARVCFIIGLSLLGPIILFFVETYMVFFTTALMGAYLFYFGIDFFAHTGFINPWLAIFDGNPRHCNTYLMSRSVYIILAFVILSTLLSIAWQYYWLIMCLNFPGFGVNVVEKKEEVEEKKEEPPAPPAYVCMPPPPYCSPQPMFMQNVGMPCYPVQPPPPAHHC